MVFPKKEKGFLFKRGKNQDEDNASVETENL